MAALINVKDAEDIVQQPALVYYVGGVPASRHTLKQGPPYRLGPAELGNWNPLGSPKPGPTRIRNLSGSFDEYALFNRVLTDAEIHKLYLQGKPNL